MIRDFWDWFASVAEQLGPSFENEVLLSELDARVSMFEGIVWEIGPGRREDNALVLSPGGDREMLAKTREIVAQAPKLPGWEFYPAKPAKHWQPVFDLQDEKGLPFRVDARSWRFALLRRKTDRATLVLVEASNVGSLSAGLRRLAAEIALDGLLGEECRIDNVDDVMVVESMDPRVAERAVPIEKLRDCTELLGGRRG